MSKRKITIRFRVTEEEKADIENKAAKAQMTKSDLIRDAIKRVKIYNPEARKIQKEKIRQIAWAGNNLNQIARAINQQGVINHELELLQKLEDIAEILKCI